MHAIPATRRRIPRLIAVVMVLAAVVGSLATIVSVPPAGAVPVDGRYVGTISNTVGGSSASMTVRLSTSAPNRSPVSAMVDIGSGMTAECHGTRPVGPTTTPLAFSAPTGGVASAAAPGTATINMTGSYTDAGSGITIPIDISATVSSDRSRLQGTATLRLSVVPFCSNAVLSFDTFSNVQYAIRTGHDGLTDPATGFDLTHMIDRQPSTMTGDWERCMYLWATPPAGTPAPTSATWAIESGAPAGAHIKAGWSGGSPGDETGPPSPLRTMVCITNATPLDTTFTVTIAPNGGAVD